LGRAPVFAEGAGQQSPKTNSGWLLPVEWWQADNTVTIGVLFEPIRTDGGAIQKTRTGLAGPSVSKQPSDGDLKGFNRALGMAVEEPLSRIGGMRLGEAI